MRVLYVSQTGMTEPLGQSQVIPYLAGLARVGYRIEIVTFEPPEATCEAIDRVREQLGDHGIAYRWLRRKRVHDVGTKVLESSRALAELLGRALVQRPRIIHARSYLAGAVAKVAAAITPGSRFIFDCRGLLGDEYVDFGHWRRGSFRHRLLKLAEGQLFGRADAVVVLTDRLRRWLRDEGQLVAAATPIAIIPCCVDLQRFVVDPTARERSRRALQAGDRLVVAYAGSLGSNYCLAEMAQLFAAIRLRRPALFAVWTRADAGALRAELKQRGIADADIAVRSATQHEMAAQLAGADAAVAFIEPRFSKIASSPVKVAEYLAMGLPVVINRGIGDQDDLLRRHPQSLLDANLMGNRDLDAVAARVVGLPADDDAARARHRLVATTHFALQEIGIARYRQLYEQLAR